MSIHVIYQMIYNSSVTLWSYIFNMYLIWPINNKWTMILISFRRRMRTLNRIVRWLRAKRLSFPDADDIHEVPVLLILALPELWTHFLYYHVI